MIYGVNDAKIILLKFVFIEAVLIPAFPGTEIVSIITFPILRIVLFSSILELIKFSTVENFSKLEGERLYVPNATFIKIYKIAGMVTLIVDSGTAFFNKANTPIFNIPEKYRPNETLYFSASYRNSTKSNTFFLYSNGNLIKSEADDNLGAYYFTISYPAKN